jgi:hypothetical protein
VIKGVGVGIGVDLIGVGIGNGLLVGVADRVAIGAFVGDGGICDGVGFVEISA